MRVAFADAVRPARAILLVEPDASCGGTLARLMRRGGDRVRVVRTTRAALDAARREAYDLAVVDLLLKGGGVDLARRLTSRVRRVYLSIGARLLGDEIIEAAVGFPVLRKGDLPARLGSAATASSPHARAGALARSRGDY